MNLIISGPQGSGKGTQARLLSQKLGIIHLETGEIFRREMEKNSPLGKRVAVFLNQGLLVPDRIVIQLLKQHLTGKIIRRGFILDGSPRTLFQIKWLDRYLTKQKTKIDQLILLQVSKKESIKRLAERKICAKCGRIYNLVTNPPEKDELCDICQIKLTVREDETPKAIAKRLKDYYSQTKPMTEYYRQKGKAIEVNGEMPIEEIHQNIMRALRSQPPRQ